MPVYQYRCTQCRHLQEALQKVNDPPLAECAECGGALQKIIAPVGIIFKGSGWHINDYRAGGGADTSAADKPAAAAGDKGEKTEKTETSTDSGSKGTTETTTPASPPPSTTPDSGGGGSASSQKQVA